MFRQHLELSSCLLSSPNSSSRTDEPLTWLHTQWSVKGCQLKMKILVPTTTQQSNLHQLASGTGFFRAGGVILCQKEGTHQIQEIDVRFCYLWYVICSKRLTTRGGHRHPRTTSSYAIVLCIIYNLKQLRLLADAITFCLNECIFIVLAARGTFTLPEVWSHSIRIVNRLETICDTYILHSSSHRKPYHIFVHNGQASSQSTWNHSFSQIERGGIKIGNVKFRELFWL